VIAPPLGSAIQLLDAGRSRLYLALRPVAPTWLADRDRRIAAAGVLLLLSALLTASTAPLVLLALGPIIWGVPHLVADLRYLVTRPKFHRAPALYAAGAVVAALSTLGYGVRAGLAGAAAAALLSRGAWTRRVTVVMAAGALFALAHRSPYAADALFVHGHNLVAFVYWIAWRRAGKTPWAVFGVFAAASAWIFWGPMPPLLLAQSTSWSGLDLGTFASFLAPPGDPGTALRFVIFFGFAQAAHYIVWLHLLPQQIADHGRPRTFAQSYRSLVKDVGAPILWLAAAAAVLVAGTALGSLRLARDVYLGIAFFHAHLELIAAALFLSAPRAR
jgi:hypothetical protein